ncbi:hypothetical protein ACMZ7D_00270 [Gardnerella vaginalis]|uniref:hypothetical protein n=1 Tax=Gardnerella vaginalis TaxID=2702 RepID=UPI0039F0C4F0
MIWLNCEAQCASHAKSAERLCREDKRSTLRWRGSPLDFLSVPAHSSKELKAHYAALSSVDSQPFDGDSLSEEEKLKNLGD